MKRALIIFLVISFSAQAQVDTYDYLYFCDKMMAKTANSIACIHHLYSDLKSFKKNPNFPIRYFEQYICIQQPDEKDYNVIKNGPANFFKTVDNELWKLYNDCYKKNAEIVVYIRLEDYKTNIDKGFALVREMQELQIAMGKARDKIADKVAADAKAATASNSYIKPYQFLMKVAVHEDELIRKLAENFNDDQFIGFPHEEILKSYLETDDLIQTFFANKFTVPDAAYLKATIEGLQEMQKAKENALNTFNNTSTFDGKDTNFFYDNISGIFNNDFLHYFANFCGQARTNYYPGPLRESDFDSPAVEWPLTNVNYSPPSLDTITTTKAPAALTNREFKQLDNTVYYLDLCVLTMENIFKSLRYEEVWNDIRDGDMPRKNPELKFDKVTVPVALHGMLVKDSKYLTAPYRNSLMARVNDVQLTMLALQENLMGISKYLKSGEFRQKGAGYIDETLTNVEKLYTELDLRKEKLYYETRKVYNAYPRKTESWTTSAAALLKAADHSRSILHQVDKRVYEGNTSPISTAAIHEDQRDLITNQFTYMKGIGRLDNSGMDPYTPYDYIPGYLKTLEEKITDMNPNIEDKNKVYGDILYMHNIIAYQYSRFADIGSAHNILSYIRQPPKYHHVIPKPKEPEPKEPEPINEPLQVADIPRDPISFEGYPFNNLVLLLDVSASMNKPERLPLLKWSFQQLIRDMRKEDEVGIVIYSGKATVALPPQSASDTATIFRAIERLRSEGNTNIADGITLAYKTANKNFIDDGNNKIILATDGGFRMTESILKIVDKNSPKITLTVFDFSQLADPLKAMQELAERGKGNYVKVTVDNSLDVLATEARKEK